MSVRDLRNSIATVRRMGLRGLRAAVVGAFSALILTTACAPPGVPLSAAELAEQQRATGYQAPDGKDHTGASGDGELEKSKARIAPNGIETLSKIDRDLATRITSARVEALGGKPGPATTRVHILLRDSKLTFDYTDRDIAAKAAKDSPNEIRYKSVEGKLVDGTKAGFEAAIICLKSPVEPPKPVSADCLVATVFLKETNPNGAKADIVIRNQDVIVIAKSTLKNLKHDTLRRLVNDLQGSKPGLLQSFEVAWGPSGFALNFGDPQVCPVGRLVETNDLDEPLLLNCPGREPLRDLEGQMIGNTTRGELLLQISAATRGFIVGDTVEHIYVLVRKKSTAKTTTPPSPTAAPKSDAPPGGTPTDDDDDDDDEPVFDTERPKTPKVSVPTVKTPDTAGWLIPINANHPFTKVFASDRKNPIIDRGIKTWLNGKRLKTFAQHFLPNRTLVTNKLAISQVPAEFALILFGESRFFQDKSYPIEGPMKSSAWGPWQFLDDTATGNGLRIFRRLVKGRFVPGHACDERADLGRSSEAAGRYLRSIINMFPHDPKLVLLGYNQGEYGVRSKVTSLKNTGSQERLAVIKEIGLNFWTIRRFNMASSSGIKYVENFVSVYHAALESDPVPLDPSIAAWKPNAQCGAID